MYRRVFALLLLIFTDARHAVENEPLCLSRYDYDYKMLQKMVKLEQEQNNMKKLLDKQADTIKTQEKTIDQLSTEYKETIMATASVHVRWGRTECPGNGTEMVYAGYAGGSEYRHKGAAASYLCLPIDPLWGEYDDTMQNHGYVYGAEFELPEGRDSTLFKKSLHHYDVTCAVCRSSRSSTIMIPARNQCYSGWTLEYSDYLMAGAYEHAAASEYVCMDEAPEVVPGGQSAEHGKLFYAVEAQCGSLRCPPYVQGRELTCVLCTK